MKNSMWLKMLYFLVFSFISSRSAYAGEDTTISVQVSIDVNALTVRWTEDESKEFYTASRQLLTSSLKAKYPYWNFCDDENEHPYTVRLRVFDPYPEDGKYEAHIRLEAVTPPNNQNSTWPSHSWLNSIELGDAHLFPSVSNIPKTLVRLLEDHFLNNRTIEFRKWLKDTIPLAYGGNWLKKNISVPDFRIVLPLSSDNFLNLRASWFRIECQAVKGPIERLRAFGISEDAPYLSASGEIKIFDALVVKADSIEKNGQTCTLAPNVKEFYFGPVYLFQEETPILDIDIHKEDGE